MFDEAEHFYDIGGFILIEYKIDAVVVHNFYVLFETVIVEAEALLGVWERECVVARCKSTRSLRIIIIQIKVLLGQLNDFVIIDVVKLGLAVKLKIYDRNHAWIYNLRYLMIS